jgi:hypothetical protein
MDDTPRTPHNAAPVPVDPVTVLRRAREELAGLRTPPPIRVDVEQLSKALEPVVNALIDIRRAMAEVAPAVEALGRQMQQAQQEQARRTRHRPHGA